jgi:hypothetical protein
MRIGFAWVSGNEQKKVSAVQEILPPLVRLANIRGAACYNPASSAIIFDGRFKWSGPSRRCRQEIRRVTIRGYGVNQIATVQALNFDRSLRQRRSFSLKGQPKGSAKNLWLSKKMKR